MPTSMRMGCAKAALRQIKDLYQRGADLRESNTKPAGIRGCLSRSCRVYPPGVKALKAIMVEVSLIPGTLCSC